MAPPVAEATCFENHGTHEKELALKLFIELLAYQLAFPVRWIETQQQLFQSELRVERFVEIGPRTILATMAERSSAIYSNSQPSCRYSNPEFLSYHDNERKILYQYEEEVPDREQDSQTTAQNMTEKATPPPSGVVQSLPDGAQLRAEPSADLSLSASHIVLALTAQKLRRRFDQISVDKSIRDLSGGKSTLQNELTGDLAIEFGQIPEGIEDKSLSALGDIFQTKFSGIPGKAMSSLVSSLISRKMPAGFNQGVIEGYLNSRWGFSKAHARIVLCMATTMEPEDRLSNAGEARLYLDDLIHRYSIFQGITLTALVKPSDIKQCHTPVVVDMASFDELSQRHQRLCYAQFSALSNYLDVNLSVTERQLKQSEMAVLELTETVNLLNTEFDDQFIRGIKPIFNADQARGYDSWWNWGREDLIRVLNEICQDPSSACHAETENRIQRLLNRWDKTCIQIVQARLEKLEALQGGRTAVIRGILDEILSLGYETLSIDPRFVHLLHPVRPRTTITDGGHIKYRELPRQTRYYQEVIRYGPGWAKNDANAPFVHIKTRRDGEDWQYDIDATSLYHAMLDIGTTTGLTYTNKAVLLTGAGPNSIAAKIIEGLLSGGACVVVTTSRPVAESAALYQQLYRQFGARESSLTLLPMNQASRQDCEMLVEHIYGANSPTGGDLDYIIPFAAIPQAGEPESLGGRQELALRAMLVNLLRLVGLVRRKKQRLRIENRPTMVVLPMSCNEGTFGGDGLYSESKIGLKTLFNRFYSESWSKYVTICGAVIGWTRGTSIMQSSNIVAEEVENLGVMTFTQAEMAFNILALMTPVMSGLAEDAPIYADLTGGIGSLWNIKKHIAAARKALSDRQLLQAAIAEEDAREHAVLNGVDSSTPEEPKARCRRARLRLPFPLLGDLDRKHPSLEGMVDLSRVVVVVGYSELGPWGNARTRWEIEQTGKFSLEGYIEMAWLMGLIKHVDGQLKGEPYVGWVDRETETPVDDDSVPQRYHQQIMNHAGIRLIQPNKQDRYDPSRKEFLHEIAVEEDMVPFETTRSAAEAFKLRHGDQIDVQPTANSDNYRVRVKKGAVLMIPKAVPFHHVVAGRMPQGWDPARYGIPEDIIQQVDVTTLYALCCVSEAFLSAGIKDPYELYKHIHVSELANCLGSGGGPMKVIQSMYRDRYLDRPIRGDMMLEHFMNSMGAWVNMLLLSAAGPLKTPVGACATALESLDIGCEAIQGGKCKVAIVGGCDDYGEELAYEFANIKATANSTEELAKGRAPAEISRPTASSRNGFAESTGCGVQILMSAELAVKMGLPIYGVVAYTQMASDQIGRSIPAPGKGILTAAREAKNVRDSPLLDLSFRRAAFDKELLDTMGRFYPTDQEAEESALSDRTVSNAARCKIRDAQHRWGNDIRLLEPSISPIRASLATWGLTIDDITVVSMHGTSTKANEINECDVINTQMEHLGRQNGNPLLSVCQKSLTGHPKAAAGAWQLNGCLQMLQDGVIPGNRNADNIDRQLQQFEHLVYPMESIKVPEVKATLLTSFGFGQKGAISITVSPKYLFASLSAPVYDDYRTRVTKRQRSITPTFVSRLTKNNLVQVKTRPPWNDSEAMREFFLDPTSRVVDGRALHAGQTPYQAAKPSLSMDPPIAETVQAMLETLKGSAGPASPGTTIGVDIENIANISIENIAFVSRNFTAAEREYCLQASNPRASFAGRWSAKEAVFKCLQTPTAGAGAAMQDIEILNVNEIPQVILHGRAQQVADSKGITKIEITISHCDEKAIAVALAVRKDGCND
ncbi:hypothetical protein BJX61DRAFT_538812 [Aspergillus egyptiacus]|nr:hypothetical protein BJX61DRAFT_538812 [Aspergillus egyptiacus]